MSLLTDAKNYRATLGVPGTVMLSEKIYFMNTFLKCDVIM